MFHPIRVLFLKKKMGVNFFRVKNDQTGGGGGGGGGFGKRPHFFTFFFFEPFPKLIAHIYIYTSLNLLINIKTSDWIYFEYFVVSCWIWSTSFKVVELYKNNGNGMKRGRASKTWFCNAILFKYSNKMLDSKPTSPKLKKG